jgi:hypothetical protein
MKNHSKGKYSSYHWDSKAAIVDYIENEKPGLAKKLSLLYVGGYATNPLFYPKLDPASGKHFFFLTASKAMRMPIIDQNKSTGIFVRALIENEKAGTKLIAADSYLRMEELAEVFKRVAGVDAAIVELTIEDMNKKFGIPLEVLSAPAYVDEFGYAGGVDGIIEPSGLTVKVQTKSFEDWLKEQDLEKVIEFGQAQLRSVQK